MPDGLGLPALLVTSYEPSATCFISDFLVRVVRLPSPLVEKRPGVGARVSGSTRAGLGAQACQCFKSELRGVVEVRLGALSQPACQ